MNECFQKEKSLNDLIVSYNLIPDSIHALFNSMDIY